MLDKNHTVTYFAHCVWRCNALLPYWKTYIRQFCTNLPNQLSLLPVLLAKLMEKAHMISQALVTWSWNKVALCRAGETDVLSDQWWQRLRAVFWIANILQV